MCHSWVKRIIRWDRNKVFKFSPLEGDAAKKILTPLLPDYIREDTIIYFEDGKYFLRSDAALKIGQALGFPYNIGGSLGWVVPKALRDSIYKWVAARRFKYGERYDQCPLPPPEWRDRFM